MLQLQAYLITFRNVLGTLEILDILAHVSNAVRKTLSRNIRVFLPPFLPSLSLLEIPLPMSPEEEPRAETESILKSFFSLGVDGGLLSLNTFLGGEGGC